MNQIVLEDNKAYEYDDNGNLIRISIEGILISDYSYDNQDRLIQVLLVDDNKTTSESYLYDYAGRRIAKSTNGKVVNYLVDTSGMLSHVLAEYDHEDNLLVYYTRGDDLISQERQGQKHYYLYDGHNSVRKLVDEDGNITDTYTYDAFGNLTGRTGTTENNYLYCGEEFNGTTGLYYLRARYMNPSTGTFISMDKYQGTINDPIGLHKYLYANANPVMYSDPTGYSSGTLKESMETVAILGILAAMTLASIGPAIEIITFLTSELRIDYITPVITDIVDTVWGLQKGRTAVGDVAIDIRDDADSDVVPIPITVEVSDVKTKNRRNDKTYYHATSHERAVIILSTGILKGGGWEGKRVFVWAEKPTKKAVKLSGARIGALIRFKTMAAFEPDPGITNTYVKKYNPMRSVFSIAIKIKDAHLVVQY